MNMTTPNPGANIRSRFSSVLGEVSEAAKVAAEFADCNVLRISNYDKEGFIRNWTNYIGISPLKFAAFMTENLQGHHTDISIGFEDKGSKFALSLKAMDASDESNIDYSHPCLENNRIFDLSKGVILPGDILKRKSSSINGKAMLGRTFELGHIIGCDEMQIEAGKKGPYIWANVFEIDTVNPEFQSNMQHRLDKIKKNIDKSLFKKLKAAIKNGDIRTIASIDDLTPMRLDNSSFMSIYEQTMYQEQPPAITIAKYLLFDDYTRGWTGHLNLKNPEHCARAHQKLGQWTLPDLRQRAKTYIAAHQEAEAQPVTNTSYGLAAE